MPYYISIIAICLFLSACSHNGKHQANSQIKLDKKTQLSEMNIQKSWDGKHVKSLVTKYGEPDMIMNTTLLGGPASEGYVYEQHRLAGNPSCINVYVVYMEDDTIYKYFCR